MLTLCCWRPGDGEWGAGSHQLAEFRVADWIARRIAALRRELRRGKGRECRDNAGSCETHLDGLRYGLRKARMNE